jgi:hypothetical protein
MRVFEDRHGWQPIDSAPLDEDVSLMVTDGRGGEPYRLPVPMQAYRGRLGQFEQGIAADGHAAEMEAVLCQPQDHPMTPRRFPPPWRIISAGDDLLNIGSPC